MKFYTVGKDGKHRVLELTKSVWTGEPCFTDGEEYYYINGGYDDDIIEYWPCKRKSLIRSIIIGIMLIWFGYCLGATVKSINCNNVLMEEKNV